MTTLTQNPRAGVWEYRRSIWRWLCMPALAAIWLAAGMLGWGALLQHTFQPAPTADVPPHWPTGAVSAPSSANFRIVVFAHPCCPCTHATLHKLDESLTRLPGDTSIRVVFVTSGLNPADISGSPGVAFARRLPGVELQFDQTGEISRRFHATVSGEVFAFDRTGRLMFHGGLTAGRGHLGDSVGQQQLESLLRGAARKPFKAPVFGCSLPGGALTPGMLDARAAVSQSSPTLTHRN